MQIVTSVRMTGHFSVLALALALMAMPLFGSPASHSSTWTAAYRNCALAMLLSSPFIVNQWSGLPPLTERQQAYEVQSNANLAVEPLAYLMGPGRIYLGLLGRRMNGHSIPSAFENTIRRDYPYALGYFGLLLGLRRLSRAFFSIPFTEFVSEMEARLNRPPRNVVHLNGFKLGSFEHFFDEADFSKRYGSHPHMTYETFSSLAELVEKLSSLPQERSVDRLEIVIHGQPGRIEFADGSGATADEVVALLSQAPLRLMAPNSDVVFLSCSLGVRTPFGAEGERLLRSFGNFLLPESGTVVGSTKNLILRRRRPELPEPVVGSIVHFMGLGNYEIVLGMLSSIWRDYRDAGQDLKVLTIPASPSQLEE